MAEIIYAKYNKLRRREFRTYTCICEENGSRWVEKRAIYPEAEAHIDKLALRSAQLEKAYPHLSFAKAVRTEQGVRFDYITGPSVDSLMAQKIKTAEGLKEGFLDVFKRIVPVVREKRPLRITPEFQTVFGKGTGLEGLPAVRLANIDCILENFVVKDDRIVCLDYEWVFDFDVPIDFIRYRVVHYFYQAHPEMSRLADEAKLLAQFGLSSMDCALYEAMEMEFQRYVFGGEENCRYTDRYQQAVTTFDQVLAEKEMQKNTITELEQQRDELQKVVDHYRQVEGKLRKTGLWQAMQLVQKAGRKIGQKIKGY